MGKKEIKLIGLKIPRNIAVKSEAKAAPDISAK